MAVPAPSKASVPSPAPKPPKPGIDIFTQIWPRKKRKGRKRRGHNPPARYGLLRNFFAYIPKWLASLQYRLVMMVDSVSHTVLFVLVLAELLGLDILSGRSRSVLARPLGSARRLLSLAYDSSLGIVQLLLTAPRLFFAFPNDDVMVILRRVAILQCCLGSSLHYSSVVRWKTRSCEYRVPPLLILVAYFLLPWTTLCGFLLLVRPGDHKVGSVTMDLLVLAAFAALRVGLFGRYGRPRMPRAPQPWWMRLVDAAVLGSIMLFLELGLLRNAWIERRKNWKYVFAGLLLALPVPFWRYLLRFFREERDGVKKAKGALKADRADRVTREDVRADIYGKLRPGVPIGAAKKKKQKMSLAEALDRQKKEAEMDKSKKEEAKLEAEETFWEGPPSSTEMFAPFLSCFVVIGIIPFIAAVNRQFRVKYKITNQRVSVTGGLDGKDITEFSYQEIYEMKYGMRFFGYCADMRINLRDGAKVELFGLLNFEENYNFMLSRVDKDARKRSDPPPSVA